MPQYWPLLRKIIAKPTFLRRQITPHLRPIMQEGRETLAACSVSPAQMLPHTWVLSRSGGQVGFSGDDPNSVNASWLVINSSEAQLARCQEHIFENDFGLCGLLFWAFLELSMQGPTTNQGFSGGSKISCTATSTSSPGDSSAEPHAQSYQAGF